MAFKYFSPNSKRRHNENRKGLRNVQLMLAVQ